MQVYLYQINSNLKNDVIDAFEGEKRGNVLDS